MSLGQMLEETCAAFPERVALIYEERRITYEELNRAVNALGTKLKEAGFEKGDKLAIMLPNCPEFVIAYFAAQKIGAVAVTINVLSTPYELHHLLSNSDAKGLITTASLAGKFEEIKKELPLCRFLLIHDEQTVSSPFQKAIKEGNPSLTMPQFHDDDPAVMIYTSGLTGKPLGAVLTQRNLRIQADLLKVVCGTTEEDRGLAVIPFFHSFGAVVNMLCALRVGASIVIMDHFSVEGILSTIESEKITYIAAVPRLFLGMILHENERKYDLSSLKLCISGGAAMPPEYFARFEEKFGIKIMEGYGLTEASPVCTFTRPYMKHKPGSIGTVVPGVEAKIVDDNDHDLPPGEIGELLIRGYNVMKGYYKDEAATAQVMRNGWLHTGDLARMDEEGYLYITGRKKRMIIVSGFNVYPKEVEMVLCMHPAVKEALAVGKEDLLRGEVVKARVVKKEGMEVSERDLIRHCRKYLSSYKVPREIEFVESLCHGGPVEP